MEYMIGMLGCNVKYIFEKKKKNQYIVATTHNLKLDCILSSNNDNVGSFGFNCPLRQ